MSLLLLPAAVLLLPGAAPPQDPGAAPPQDTGAAPPQDAPGAAARRWLELPESAAERAWAGVGATTPPAPGAAELAALAAADWSAADTWERWAGLVRATRDAPTAPDRAALCLFARGHGRGADAWRHFEALGAEPTWLAALAPALFPGAPAGTPVEAGGRPGPLPDGVLLEPLLPPDSGRLPRGAIEWRTAHARGLRIGDAVVDLAVSVESTGVQVDVTHVSGGAATVRVRIPEPDGFEVRMEYLDWMRVETLREPIAIPLSPDDEEPHTLWGRLQESRSSLPTGVAERLPQQIAEGALVLALPADDRERDSIEAVARAVEDVLGARVVVGEGTAKGDDGGWTSTTLRLPPPGPEREERLRYLASTVETFALDASR